MKGPNAGTATRINRKEPPHSALSNTRPAKSRGLTKRSFQLQRASCRANILFARPGEYVALVLEQAFFEVKPAVEAAERAVGGDDPVAGHDDGKDVAGVGAADGPRRAGTPEGIGDLAIGPGLAERYARELRPHLLLPLRAGECHRHVEGLAPSVRVLGQFLAYAGGPGLVRLHGVALVLQVLFHNGPVVTLHEVQAYQGPVFVHRERERTGGGINLGHVCLHAT